MFQHELDPREQGVRCVSFRVQSQRVIGSNYGGPVRCSSVHCDCKRLSMAEHVIAWSMPWTAEVHVDGKW